MATRELRYTDSDGRPRRGWLAVPEGSERGPAVLVVHEILGLINNQKPILERFARQGYVAFAPDLFEGRGPGPICVARTLRTLSRGDGPAMDDLRAALEFLHKHQRVDGDRICVAGFCMGGGFALLMGLEPGIRASAPFYGTTPAFLERTVQSCPVVASFGERDSVFRKKGQTLKSALEHHGIEHDFRMYPGAGHSFMTEELPGVQGWVASVGPLKVGYSPEAAEDAWTRMLSFFEKHTSAER